MASKKLFQWAVWGIVLVFIISTAGAQSTFGSFVGTVRDPSGSVILDCTVTILNTGTGLTRTTRTDQTGSYEFVNLEPGTYKITMQAAGFEQAVYADLLLQTRQTIRVDGALVLGTQAQTVSVESAAPVVTTDVSNLAETKTGRELNDLPVAIASRASGSTSPVTTLTTQVGVQTDASGNISIAGSKPAMVSYSLDGITNTNPKTTNSPVLTELFPSFDSIAEIRISEVNNSAEFGGVSDVTTISKGGTNAWHGGLFENVQNSDFNARNTFSATVPILKMNDFGGSLSGPVMLPKLYNGHNKTFFFVTYEGLRLPKQTVLTESVPSLALRQGDLSYYNKVIKDPLNGGVPFPNGQIPSTRISSVAQQAIQYLYPMPNAVGPNPVTNNFVDNFPAPLTQNQGDIRLDQNVGSNQTLFARFSYKRRFNVTAPTSDSVFVGPTDAPENDANLTAAYNFIISPALVNEFRYGFSISHSATLPTYLGQEQAAQLFGLPLPQPLAAGAGVPDFVVTGFQSTGTQGYGTAISRSSTQQLLDNLTYDKGKHTIKLGADFRHLSGYFNNVWSGFRLGIYNFNGSVTNSVIGNPWAAFLLGYPDTTNLVTVTTPNLSATANHYGTYIQDDWKVTSRLTLNYGLRWEYHPSFQDSQGNLTGFLPNYYSSVNGQIVHGAIVVPNAGLKNVDPDFAASVYPMPILTATQAGLPQAMRFSQMTDFAPRAGFAWRPFGNNKTVIRGGYGKYIETLLAGIASLGWGLATANNGFYTNSLVNGIPALSFPYPFPSVLAQPGTQSLETVVNTNYKDPYVQQWNLTIERDLGFNTGIRFSYDGNHGSDLGILYNVNSLPPNTVGYAAESKNVPYPYLGYSPIETNGAISNYNAATVSVTKRMSGGLQMAVSYVYARNLSNEGGYNPTGFASEYGGTVTSPFNPGYGLDYGNVPYTRRNRVLATFLYDLPVGKGKLLAGNANAVLDRVVGGWELAGVLLFQTGPFLTVTVPAADPSGTGFPSQVGNGRADIVSGAPLYPAQQTISDWINPAAFAVPPNNVGRWPTEGVGDIVGPGTQAVSISMFKSVVFTERLRLQFGASAANLFNHPNYSPPNTTFNTASFGTISSLQSAEGAGPRAIQLGARLTF